MSDTMMQNIDRIVFTVDILRPFAISSGWESATWKNVRWLKHLIGWQVDKATQLPQTFVSWEKNGFNTASIYQALNLPIHYDTWAAIFYEENIPAHVEEALTAPFKNACVIGCEIPDIMQMAFTRQQIPYIDIVSHPVRFLDDLLFAFRTNDMRIHKHLLKHQMTVDDYCKPKANLIRAKAAWMPAFNFPEGTALITGQVATDKALICRDKKRFVSFNDYLEKIFQICATHPLVLFKPHPYQNSQCPSRRIIEAISSVKFIHHNFYHLVSQDSITDVYAINSGTVMEATYFGSKGHRLGNALYTFTDQNEQSLGKCVPVDHAFLSPAFWADILQDCVPVQTQLPKGPEARASLLRRSLNADWDYGYIDEIIQKGAVEGAKVC